MLAILSPEGNEVTDGHWWVKWVTQVEVKTMTAEWALAVNGALQEQVDRGSFDSCSAPKCHGVTWKDDEGVTWSGVPFYYLVGRADDETKARQRRLQQRAGGRRLSDRGRRRRRLHGHPGLVRR